MPILTKWFYSGWCETARSGFRQYQTNDYARARRWQQQGRTVREERSIHVFADGNSYSYCPTWPGDHDHLQRCEALWLDLCHEDAIAEDADRTKEAAR